MARQGLASEADDDKAPTASPGDAPIARDALDRMWVLVQRELRNVAHRKLASEREGHTLSTTALVNETYLKLLNQKSVSWSDRQQLFALAAQAMRRILIDYARRHRYLREQLRYDSVDGQSPRHAVFRTAASQRSDELLALDEALERLAVVEPRLCKVVECKFFAGLTDEETAEALQITARTVGRDWAKAREWLFGQLRPEGEHGADVCS